LPGERGLVRAQVWDSPLILHIGMIRFRLGPAVRGRILEVGCGRGIALRVFAERLTPRALVGVDVDPVVVALAEERVRRGGIAARVIHGDVRALPLLRPGGLFVHETPIAQHLAHPVRSFLRPLPWADAPWFERDRAAVLWAAHRKRSDGR
jgi:SAM-dependent methyltransferase